MPTIELEQLGRLRATFTGASFTTIILLVLALLFCGLPIVFLVHYVPRTSGLTWLLGFAMGVAVLVSMLPLVWSVMEQWTQRLRLDVEGQQISLDFENLKARVRKQSIITTATLMVHSVKLSRRSGRLWLTSLVFRARPFICTLRLSTSTA